MAGTSFRVDVEWEFQSGKFAPRESIVEAILDELGNADPGEIDAEEGTYAVVTFEVNEDEPVSPPSRKQVVDKLMKPCLVLGIADRKKVEQFYDLAQASGVILR